MGSGPAALAIVSVLRATSLRILVLESGTLQETPEYEELNRLELVRPWGREAQIAARKRHHGENAQVWSDEVQPYGVRCRALGGGTHGWAGKSATFDAIDFEARSWIPHSGWPLAREELAEHVNRAARLLNLGPNVYDDDLWPLLKVDAPRPEFDPERLRNCFWQFSRSQIDKFDVVRVASELAHMPADNIEVLTNATVTRLLTHEDGRTIRGVQVSTYHGQGVEISAPIVVLAAGGVENARLLLVSGAARGGLGNEHDQVGRWLMDHPSATLGHFPLQHRRRVAERFGFYGLTAADGTHMYMQGVTLSPTIQRREGLLNCAAYVLEERAADDPWDAVKRLLKNSSPHPLRDMAAIAASPALIALGLGAAAISSRFTPDFVRTKTVDALIRRFPSFVAREYRYGGVPHKLERIRIDGISEQAPDPRNRISLSDRVDRFGMPLARIDWRPGQTSAASLIRLGKTIAADLQRLGLPAPELEPWVADEDIDAAPLIDMAHTFGTTRMSNSPSTGVADVNCQVHGVSGLFVAGSSLFPTSGHANPTLMLMALAIRLGEHLKRTVRPPSAEALPSLRPPGVAAQAQM